MSISRIAVAASAAILAGMITVGSASAMPIGELNAAANTVGATVDNVAWACGPYRCFWRPGFGYWGPRHYRWGWYHRHWW